jgi:hypothetical protein
LEQEQTMAQYREQRNFGGIRFPERTEPAPGPLSLLAAQMAAEQAQHAAPLLPAVQRMLDDLPPRVKTRQLQAHNVRALERIAAKWGHGAGLLDLIDELIFEGKTGRNGFSFDAIVELTELKEYALRTRLRSRATVWDEALGLV